MSWLRTGPTRELCGKEPSQKKELFRNGGNFTLDRCLSMGDPKCFSVVRPQMKEDLNAGPDRVNGVEACLCARPISAPKVLPGIEVLRVTYKKCNAYVACNTFFIQIHNRRWVSPCHNSLYRLAKFKTPRL